MPFYPTKLYMKLSVEAEVAQMAVVAVGGSFCYSILTPTSLLGTSKVHKRHFDNHWVITT